MADIILQNDRLKVEIMQPGEEYRGGRYDWTGMTRQVTLDGKHTFLQAESPESMGGRGLVGLWEYKSEDFFYETELGDKFPMMGIGLCSRFSPVFDRAEDFQITPFLRSTQVSDDKTYVSFETQPALCGGRAMYQFKEMWIDENDLYIRQTVKNVGTKHLDLQEFNHNFMCFDGHPVDRSYKLTPCYKPIPDVRRGLFGVENDGIRVIELDGPTNSSAVKLDGFQGMSSHFMRISNDDNGMYVDVSEDFPIIRAYNWFCPEAFCCESFFDAEMDPGEEKTFTRKYTFACK